MFRESVYFKAAAVSSQLGPHGFVHAHPPHHHWSHLPSLRQPQGGPIRLSGVLWSLAQENTSHLFPRPLLKETILFICGPRHLYQPPNIGPSDLQTLTQIFCNWICTFLATPSLQYLELLFSSDYQLNAPASAPDCGLGVAGTGWCSGCSAWWSCCSTLSSTPCPTPSPPTSSSSAPSWPGAWPPWTGTAVMSSSTMWVPSFYCQTQHFHHKTC